MVALGAIVLNETYRILDAELTDGHHDLCLRLQTWWATTILLSLTNPGYTPVTVGELIGSYFIYRGNGASGDPLIIFTRGNIWRDYVRFITCYLL